MKKWWNSFVAFLKKVWSAIVRAIVEFFSSNID